MIIEDIIEHILGNGKRMAEAKAHYAQIERRMPAFEPSRREAIKYGAAGAAVLVLQGLLSGCVPRVIAQGQEITGWQAQLMKEDWIFGPKIMVRSDTHYENNCAEHLRMATTCAVDYDVNKVPISAAIPGIARQATGGSKTIQGGIVVSIRSRLKGKIYHCDTAHLSKTNDVKIEKNVSYEDIIAYSGNSGSTGGQLDMPYHLHFQLHEFNLPPASIKGQPSELGTPLSLDPEELGIDGGRPVYWDTTTRCSGYLSPPERRRGIAEFLDSFKGKLSNSELDSATASELLGRQNDVQSLKQYIGYRVFEKKRTIDGEMRPEFPPGSLMYSLMLELFQHTRPNRILVMLPLPHPMLAEFYRKHNPGVI